MSQDFHVGQRLSYDGNLCTIRFLGSVAGTSGTWIGVEWDDSTRGKHDGSFGGTRYFDCASRKGTPASFVRPSRPREQPRMFLEALKQKYAPEVTPGPQEKSIRISGKEVEEVGFEKINQQLRGLSKLRVVLLDGMRIAVNLDQSATRQQIREISNTCSSIAELDLSRNFIEEFQEVASICQALTNLRSLRLDGNRFAKVGLSKDEKAFPILETLGLEETLLKWDEIWNVCSQCPKLTSLNISGNQFSRLGKIPEANILSHITTLNLSSNDLTAISDFAAVSALPHLQILAVNHGVVRRISNTIEKFRFQSTVRRVEFAFNEIDEWDFINQLSAIFPGIESLRISHNPLYQSLQTVEGRPVSHENGYLLTIARVANLKVLNYSNVTEKDRIEADTYYLAQIGKELQNNIIDENDVVLRHPRYQELCDIYGTPDSRRSVSAKDPNSLGASLLSIHVTCEFQLQEIATREFTIEVPRRFSLYSTVGLISSQIGVPGSVVDLFWQTEQFEGSQATAHDRVSEPWDSEDDDFETEMRSTREVKLCPSTKSIGNTVDQDHISIRAVVLHNRNTLGNR